MWVYLIKNRERNEQINVLNKKHVKHERIQDTRAHDV